ncbi:unnamed protein product [Rangifer tarandus platyrhynchus]|uniref:Uncharacterized protein n=1 Tax=Rangifer tarandus platyrhynchus TaxID=3082113 RepID=A0ABN8XLN9_RANTA|nr:unnamed protein product [Rangifer tarandus platyrhynchus]CAI9689955.1 unnamed protein product [Rangifer tarandus platyrhynchus]
MDLKLHCDTLGVLRKESGIRRHRKQSEGRPGFSSWGGRRGRRGRCGRTHSPESGKKQGSRGHFPGRERRRGAGQGRSPQARSVPLIWVTQPALGARGTFVFGPGLQSPGGRQGSSRWPRAESPGVPIVQPTWLQRRPGLSWRSQDASASAEKWALCGCRNRSLVSSPQGHGERSVLAQEWVGVEEGPSGNVASLFSCGGPEEVPRGTLKPLPSGPGSASRGGRSPPPAGTAGPLPLGLLPEQLVFHLRLGPQEAQPPLVALFQTSARHMAQGASGSPGAPPARLPPRGMPSVHLACALGTRLFPPERQVSCSVVGQQRPHILPPSGLAEVTPLRRGSQQVPQPMG